MSTDKQNNAPVSAEPVRFNWNEHLQQHNALQYQHDFDLFQVVTAYVDRHIAANAAPVGAEPAFFINPRIIDPKDGTIAGGIDEALTWSREATNSHSMPVYTAPRCRPGAASREC